MQDEFLELLVDALEKEDEEVNLEDAFRDYEEWDSLSALSVMAMINEEYEVVIPRKEFDKLVTVKDLFEFVRSNRPD